MAFTSKDKDDFLDFLLIFKVREKYNVIYQNLIFIGLLCLFIVYYHSNLLLIPYKDIAIVGVSADILVTLVFIKFYRATFSIFWAVLHNLTIGFIAIYLLIWSNDNLSTHLPFQEKLPIENVELQDNHQRHNRGLAPIVTVNIKGTLHQIQYHKTALKDAIHAREVIVTLKEGFWGYWVLTDIELVDNEN